MDRTCVVFADHNIPEVASLLAVQLDEHGMGMSPGAVARALEGLVTHPERGRVLAVRTDGVAVGFAIMPFTWTVEHGGLCA